MLANGAGPDAVDGRARRAAVFAAVLAMLLGGCASVGPDYVAPDAAGLHVPDAWHERGAVPQEPRELATWWRTLGDATLDSLVSDALAANRNLQVAQARVREARARRELAGADLYPSVDASASASRSRSGGRTGPAFSLYQAGFDASWEPDVFGGARRGVEAASADLAASVEDLRDAQVSLAAEVAVNYVDVRSFQARIEIARQSLASQSETLQLTQWRTQAGLTSSLDVEQARTAVEQTRARIPALETSLAAARNRLAILADLPPGSLDARLAAPAPVPAVRASIAAGIPADTLCQRPDLRAAERRLAAQTARIGVAESQRYPALALTGSIGLDASTLAGLTSGTALAGQVAARLAQTVFDAGRLRSQVDIQTAVQEQALHSYEQAVLVALEDVENALAQLANARTRLEALTNAVDAARNAAIFAEQRYSAGIIDFNTVLDTQRTLLAVEDTLESTRADQALALVQLYKALGGGWSAGPETSREARKGAPWKTE